MNVHGYSSLIVINVDDYVSFITHQYIKSVAAVDLHLICPCPLSCVTVPFVYIAVLHLMHTITCPLHFSKDEVQCNNNDLMLGVVNLTSLNVLMCFFI